MELKQIINFLENKYHPEIAEEWDSSGFSFNFENDVKKILISIDLIPSVLEEAIINGYDLIITHHPFLFYSTKKEEYSIAPYKRKMIKKLKEHKISVYSLHTNYDGKDNSTARMIAKFLNLNSNIESIDKYNIIINEKIKFNDLAHKIKENLDLNNLQTNVSKNIYFKRIAILPGSGGIEAVLNAKKAKADLIITSDLKWNELLNLISIKNINLISVPHLIETFFAYEIKDILKEKFKDLEIDVIRLQEILKNI